MTLHAIAVFLHVVSAMTLIATMGAEWAIRAPLLRARTADEARPWVDALAGAGNAAGPAAIATLATGLYMTVRAWGYQPWIMLAMVALVSMGVIAVAMSARPVATLQRAIAAGGLDAAALAAHLRQPRLELSLRVRTTVTLGIVFLMTTKPPAIPAAVAIVVATALGLLWSLPAFSRARAQAVETAG